MKKFEEGKTYKRESGRKLASTFTVGKRTACYVFEKTCFGIENRYKIHVSENGAFEYIEVKEGRHVHTYRADMEFVRDIENTVENTENAEENTENTADTPLENVEVKTFEVGKTYYSAENGLKIKVIKHTDKMIYIERDTNSIALNSRYAVLEYNGVEYINLGEYLNYACIYATDEISDTENAADNAEVKPLETADNKITDELSKVQSCIAATKKHISDETLKLAELEKKAARIETAIANQRLIDALEDIGGSAEAIDASVAAMAANNFSAEMLNAVIAQAEKAVEIVPVTFELQHFAADMVIADTVATIDTALTDTAILPIDEVDEDDIKTKTFLTDINTLDAQIAALQAKRDKVEKALNEHIESVKKWACNKIKGDFCIKVIAYDGESRILFGDNLYFDGNANGFVISDHRRRLAIYSTAKQFKDAIHELTAVIERGDDTFTFPADNVC